MTRTPDEIDRELALLAAARRLCSGTMAPHSQSDALASAATSFARVAGGPRPET
ncbi:hypothetical protein [Mycolicibacterium hippocampi]|uniref:Uncharacterized protein n=1 Tax=Mycolicibacterium hippocampi TaxID=659824 RepID=A0A7I9ZKN8_9MYCO|nr:hypothetical protein [Mycolicibacterium hippocampi]GFH01369.1 hypothetical protein MHIP_18520 [Mycolicibacterium hippocampi]